MPHSKVRFAGFELYFDDLERARCFYTMKLGLRTIAKFDSSEILGRGLKAEQPWTAIRDPEGHTVLLLQKR